MSIEKNGMSITPVLGKRIVQSAKVGSATADDIKWLTNQLLRASAPYKSSGWVYIADISKMDPVTPNISVELVVMTKAILANGCKAIAFVEGASFMLAAQAKAHQKQSNSTVPEQHFRTMEEAVEWAERMLV